MKDPHLSGIASALAKQGRNGDDTLIHVSRKELEALKNMGDGLGIHLTKNPATGLPEAFNWLGALGGVAGGIIGTIIMPGAGTAIGAGLGSAAGTAAGGGSTQQALMAGVLGGITGYAGAGLAGGLASAGEQAVAQGVAEGVTEAGTQAATQAVTDTAGQTAAQSFGNIGAQQATQAMSQMPGLAANSGAALAEGSSQAVGSAASGSFVPNAVPLQSTPMSYGDKLAAGWDKITSSPAELGKFASDNLKGLASTGMGLMGIGALNPTESTISTGTEDTSGYKGEMYIDPVTGQRRSRAVKMARGGEAYGDYEGVDEAADGGYTPGGGLNFAEGGEADGDTDAGLPAYWAEALRLGPKRKPEGLAGGGGIGDLGGYSDGGRLLRGPGDGVSDNIPASIDGKRPARLADGEFVVPARAVSELGNGSTEAGSKQLYKMLDRIAAKRKKGKGLAYEANPAKLLPA